MRRKKTITFISKKEINTTRDILKSEMFVSDKFMKDTIALAVGEVSEKFLGIQMGENHFELSSTPQPFSKNSFFPTCNIRLIEFQQGTKIQLQFDLSFIPKMFVWTMAVIYLILLVLALIYPKVMGEMDSFFVIVGLFFVIASLLYFRERKKLLVRILSVLQIDEDSNV